VWGIDPLTQTAVADTAANSDNIWYWAGTTLMDAQHSDVLKYFGIPLTGGDANGGLAGLAVGGLLGSAIGLGNLARYASGEARGWQDEVYIDHLQPWIIYGFLADEDGNLDMYITNAFEEVIRGYISLFGGTVGESEGIKKGWMKIENVDVVGSRLGIFQEGIKRSWSRAVCSVPKAPSAANDDESSACNVGNRRVWCAGESFWRVAT
jgi:hypothetical protein